MSRDPTRVATEVKTLIVEIMIVETMIVDKMLLVASLAGFDLSLNSKIPLIKPE